MTSNGCAADSTYYVTSHVSWRVGDAAKKVTATGPMTISVAVQNSTVTGSIGGTTGFSASGVIFAAKQDISYSIASSVTSEVTYTGTYTVPAGRNGWLQWGPTAFTTTGRTAITPLPATGL